MRASRLSRISVLFLAFFIGAASLHAWHADGYVFCDVNQNGVFDEGDIPLQGVALTAVNVGGTYANSGVTLADGYYYIGIPETPDDYILTIDTTTLPADAIVVVPAAGEYQFSTSATVHSFHGVWQIDSAICRDEPEGLCWLTAGGVKFDNICNTWNAECVPENKGPKDSVGGNVYPSCSQFPGNGGNWNHVAHSLKVHLLGTDITVIRCGNVDGIDPGSESPVCAVNFIEFEGTGRLQGIHGNKFDPIDVTFFARAEDRNEPGNEQSADSGADTDHYFLRVVDSDGNVHILVDADGVDDGQVDPLTITGGNFQIHCTSCSDGGGASLMVGPEHGDYFLRGDSNFDGMVNVSDAISTLTYLFDKSGALACEDAADTNDDGRIDISDSLHALIALYSGGSPIPDPHPEPGNDPTPDPLDCHVFPELSSR